MSEKRIDKLEERLFGSSSPSGEEGNIGEIKELEVQQGRIDVEISILKKNLNSRITHINKLVEWNRNLEKVLLNFLKIFNENYFCDQEWYENQLKILSFPKTEKKMFSVGYNENYRRRCPYCSGILKTTKEGDYICHECGEMFREYLLNVGSRGEKLVCEGSDTLGVNKDGSPINSKSPESVKGFDWDKDKTKPNPCCKDCIRRNEVKENCYVYIHRKCPYYKASKVEKSKHKDVNRNISKISPKKKTDISRFKDPNFWLFKDAIYLDKKDLDSKLPELVLNDPCQPCEEDVECNECPYARPELDKYEKGELEKDLNAIGIYPERGKQWVRFEVVNRLLEKQNKKIIDEFVIDINNSSFEYLSDKIKLREKWEKMY